MAVTLVGAAAQSQSINDQSTSSPAPPPQTRGAVSTGGAYAPALDEGKRSITAGGFADSGPTVFQDIAEKAGLTRWRHVMGTDQKKFILETVGSGVALLDFDNDGWLDIYFVNGSIYDAMSGKTEPPHAALFHNNHDGTFTDVAEKAGVTLGNWSTGPTFGDYDGDGRLDLFVPGYVHYDLAHPPLPGSPEVAFSTYQFRAINVMCGPRGLKGEPDHLSSTTMEMVRSPMSARRPALAIPTDITVLPPCSRT
jgi:hypothetical protein